MRTPPDWSTFCKQYLYEPTLSMGLDLSRMDLPETLFQEFEETFQRVFSEMNALEAGEIANPDEQRMVGHYWLRAPGLAPNSQIQEDIHNCVKQVQTFAADIHSGKIKPPNAERFTQFLLIGIGGSALGPQLVSDALRTANDPMTAYFIDNTDPDGIDRILGDLGADLASTLVLTVSKSGGTKETRNGMLEIQNAYTQKGLDFGKHAAVITGKGSPLEQKAKEMGVLDIFPMWDWVGGRTSVFSAVGLLPAALQGIDIEAMRQGAALTDAATRKAVLRQNPSALLALSWHHAGNGKGDRDMVMLPYKDRLLLLSRYLQQLVMESLGKELDLQGNTVNQGIAVYGNKGSTDQHAYIQQLREGPDNFFATFIEILEERQGPAVEVEPGVTSGDYLLGFLFGTREALWQNGHRSITLTLPDVSPRTLGILIALYERAVGFYASLVGINAYHQPGVEAGKKAAGDFLALQKQVLEVLQKQPEQAVDIPTLTKELNSSQPTDALFYLMEYLTANGRLSAEGEHPTTRSYQWKS